MDQFLPFDELQAHRNEVYYKKRGNKLYSDFKTFGSEMRVAHANAVEFVAYAKKHPDEELFVYEFGIGNALFGKHFLAKLKTLETKLLARLVYTQCDLSAKLLKDAEKTLKGFDVHFVECDAAKPLSFIKKAHYVRSNEMYDDLPARILVRTDEGISEVHMDAKLQKKYVPFDTDKTAVRFMQTMPKGYEIPWNYTTYLHFDECKKKLADDGWIDGYDYGFGTIEDITKYPSDIWNNAVVRDFNSQLTVDINFIPVIETHKATIQRQKEYAERALGIRLYCVELDQFYYFSEEEIKKNAKKLAKEGYPKDFFKTTEEIDDYWHIRIR